MVGSWTRCLSRKVPKQHEHSNLIATGNHKPHEDTASYKEFVCSFAIFPNSCICRLFVHLFISFYLTIFAYIFPCFLDGCRHVMMTDRSFEIFQYPTFYQVCKTFNSRDVCITIVKTTFQKRQTIPISLHLQLQCPHL